MQNNRVFFRLLLVVVSVLINCTSVFATPTPPVKFTVMTFNIENGGTGVSFNNIVEAIKKSNADVVGIQESWGNIPRLAKALGWKYYDQSQAIISRFPLLDLPNSNNLYTYIEVQPGKVVAMANMHLPDEPYGPDKVREGQSSAAVVNIEKKVRLPTALPFIEKIAQLSKKGVPVFITGDFNSPSDLDWTAETVNKQRNHRYVVEWPVTKKIESEGLIDSFRKIYPDPVTTAGLTWPSGRPFIKNSIDGFNPSPSDLPDRVDFIFTGGNSKVINSQILGEANNKSVNISTTPWASDHRAVVSNFEVNPVTPPIFITTLYRTQYIGTPLYLAYHAPSQNSKIELAGPNDLSLTKKNTSTDGQVIFMTDHLKSGMYQASLWVNNTNLSQVKFWLAPKNAVPNITVSPSCVKVGEPIKISWNNTQANRLDYIRINPVGSKKLDWGEAVRLYTRASVNGSLFYDANDVKGNWLDWHKGEEGKWPLSPGIYDVKFMLDDGMSELAATKITVTKDGKCS